MMILCLMGGGGGGSERQPWAQTMASPKSNWDLSSGCSWKTSFSFQYNKGSSGSLQNDAQTNSVGTIVVLKLTHWTLTLKIYAATGRDFLCEVKSFFSTCVPLSPIICSLAMKAVTTMGVRCFLPCLHYT